MEEILKAEKGTKLLLSGNEAIARGAVEARIEVATTYPGTPASEIGDTLYRISKLAGFHFEYSINEKVAYEVAYGASLAGARAITSMKHLGLNVAGDPFVTSAYVGTVGGFIIVSAGEPALYTSPNEQDHRYFARMAYIPVLDPSDPQDALEMTRTGFELSERYHLPILLRPTTRVSHTQMICTAGQFSRRQEKPKFEKNQSRFVPIPKNAQVLRRWLIERIARAVNDEKLKSLNMVEGDGTHLTIITSGVSYLYVKEAIRTVDAEKKVRIVKVGVPFPLDGNFIKNTCSGAKKILVVEELEPFIESQVREILFKGGWNIPFYGKKNWHGDGYVELIGELSHTKVAEAIDAILSGSAPLKTETEKTDTTQKTTAPETMLPPRPPVLCPGCPHRASFLALKLVAGEDDIFLNDIGCYTLGMDPPFNMGDILLCMGSSITQGSGVGKVTGAKVIAFIGDSTFYHSGVTGLTNAVINNHNLLVMILDNRVTAMTGHQPSPSALSIWRQEEGEGEAISIEQMCRACGVKKVAVVNPVNPFETNRIVKKFYDSDGVRVIISRYPCPIFEGYIARKKSAPAERKIYQVESSLCRTCSLTGGKQFCSAKTHPDYSFIRTKVRIEETTPFSPFESNVPCQKACPTGMCVQGFIHLARAGRMRESFEMIQSQLILPSVLSRICPAFCEQACLRHEGEEGGGVAINDIKRYIIEQLSEEEKAEVAKNILAEQKLNGKKVAVVGSGPAGLAAAWELRRRGYRVKIFERENRPGGLLRWAIPKFRLPQSAVDEDIGRILKNTQGIEVEYGVTFGKDMGIRDAFSDGFSALFLGCGAGVDALPEIEGVKAQGVEGCLEFMKKVAKGQIEKIEGDVIVVGGGDSACDVARTALRLGAGRVSIVYRRGKNQMPASPDGVEEALAEGVKILDRKMVVKISISGAVATGIITIETRQGEPDKSGRPRPIPVEGTERVIPAQLIIFATGQEIDPATRGGLGASMIKNRTVLVDAETLESSVSNVFAGGDMVTGPSTVVEAIAAGRRAAASIDAKLGGIKLEGRKLKTEGRKIYQLNPSYIKRTERNYPPVLPPDVRVKSFDAVRKSFSYEQFKRESERCLGCGICGLCMSCLEATGCPALVAGEGEKIKIDPSMCTGCGLCSAVCPNGAIKQVDAPRPMAEIEKPVREAKELVKIEGEATSSIKNLKRSNQLKIHFAGVGGQGSLTAVGVAGQACMHAGINVIISGLHGMAQRGGTVTNQIMVGDVISPVVEVGEADVLIGFEPVETLRSIRFLKAGGLIIMGDASVPPFSVTRGEVSYPQMEFIVQRLNEKADALITISSRAIASMAGNPRAISPVMLGAIAGAGILPVEPAVLKEALLSKTPPSRAQITEKAFDKAFNAVKTKIEKISVNLKM